MKTPYVFDEFFSSGLEESVSPFLTPRSRRWGKNLSLRSASAAAILLALAFAFSFINAPASYLCLSFVYFLVGTPALIAAIDDLKNLEINIDVLMTVAAFVAVLIDSGLEGALLLVLFELSHGMEDAVSKKARSALHNLNNLAPKFAYIVADDKTLYEKSVREIGIGEKLFIKSGEIIPLDGKVVEGSSTLNLVHLTGESVPIPKAVGDADPVGGRNLESGIVVEVTRISADSTLSRIIQLITQAQEAKPRLERWLDRFGKRYAEAVIALTFIAALALPFLFSTTFFGHEGSVYRALAFLIAASPCALIIATPTAYLSAISSCARKGILLKGGITLDALASCKTIAFDKTGTLTTGDLACLSIEPAGPVSLSSDEALSIAYGLERHAVHPIAAAITKLAESKKIPPAEISAFQSIPGFGLSGKYGGKDLWIGFPEHVALKLSADRRGLVEKAAEKKRKEGQALAALSIGDEVYLFVFADQVRQETPDLLHKLKKERLKTVMLTGDHAESAHAVGKMLGLDAIYANLRPEDKLAKVAELSMSGGLAMVGDGINDAPALARATVGISMGRIGSATAVDASDAVLLNDDLHLLPWLIGRSRKTLRIVKQNLTLALGVIFLATTPALLGLVPLWAAVLLHEGGTVLVGLNSLRLLRK